MKSKSQGGVGIEKASQKDALQSNFRDSKSEVGRDTFRLATLQYKASIPCHVSPLHYFKGPTSTLRVWRPFPHSLSESLPQLLHSTRSRVFRSLAIQTFHSMLLFFVSRSEVLKCLVFHVILDCLAFVLLLSIPQVNRTSSTSVLRVEL